MEVMQKRVIESYKVLYLISFILLVLFGRSLTGIYILGFRVGELAIGASLLVSLYFLIFAKRDNKYFYFGDKTFYIMKFIFISFFITLFFTGGSLTSLYTYKSSSYIWTISFLFMGMFVFKNMKHNEAIFKAFPYLLPLTYILSSLYYPQFLVDFFVRFSDKFDYLKASDVFLIFVFTNIVNQKLFKKEFSYYLYLLLSSAIFLPLFLFKSKGAFLPASLFLLCELIRTRRTFLNNKIKSIILMALCVPIFYLSTYNVGLQLFVNNYTLEETVAEQITASVSRASEEKNIKTTLFGGFFIMDGRLYTEEQMANWRLQIWQDAVRDLFWESTYINPDGLNYARIEGESRQDLFLTGFGYNGILPSMDDSSRRGIDMKNENVHNFAVNILAKGGILQFTLFVSMYLSMIAYWYKQNKNYKLFSFITFALMTAFFDVAMESVRFPFIYFGAIAYLFNNEK